jgi:hypothetical protein
MQQPPKKNKITVKRAMEVADSLKNVGNKNLRLGDSQKKYIGKDINYLMNQPEEKGGFSENVKVAIKHGDGGIYVSGDNKLKDPRTFGTSADEKIESGKRDLKNAERYKALALKAMKKNK